jgi:uncharacterized YccA/Bax inhibitor family protein
MLEMIRGRHPSPGANPMRTGNPALNDKTFENFGVYPRDLTSEQSRAGTMTINGTAQKTMFLLLLAMGSACFTWSKTFTGLEANPAAAMPWAFGGRSWV